MKRSAAALNTRGASQPARKKEQTAGPRGEATSSGDAQPAAEVPAAAVMAGPRGAATRSDATKRVRVCSASSGAAQPAAELSAADERAGPPRAATTSGATQRDRELSASQARLEQEVLAFGRWPLEIKTATTPDQQTEKRIRKRLNEQAPAFQERVKRGLGSLGSSSSASLPAAPLSATQEAIVAEVLALREYPTRSTNPKLSHWNYLTLEIREELRRTRRNRIVLDQWCV